MSQTDCVPLHSHRLPVLIPHCIWLIPVIISCILSYSEVHSAPGRIVIQHGGFHIGKNLCIRTQFRKMPYVYKILGCDSSVDLRTRKPYRTRARASSKESPFMHSPTAKDASGQTPGIAPLPLLLLFYTLPDQKRLQEPVPRHDTDFRSYLSGRASEAQ